jgi:two-component system capsular synthesis sensor histidine kinase RcsC
MSWRRVERAHQNYSDLLHKIARRNAAQKRFLATVGHEIRTLLYGMLASIELMGRTRLDKTQTQLADAMACSAGMLKDILNDTLDFTRLETENCTEACAIEAVLQECDVCAIAVSVVRGFSARAALKGLQLDCRLDPALAGLWWGDPLKITQVLNNFLNNAVKFTARGGVTIWGKLLADTGDGVASIELSVRDTGPGIAEEDADRIFKLFEQAGASAGTSVGASFPGSGLGLYICKKFAAAMGATIDLISSPGRGSSFILRLSLQRSSAVSAAAADTLPPPESPRNIDADVLIVDDHAINRLLLEKQLSAIGCRVTAAAGGAEALAYGRRFDLNFDLILTDLNMPGIDGYALARAWRAAGVRCPIVAITANASAAERERCLVAGMDDCLVKPFGMEALEKLMARRVELCPEFPAASPAKAESHRWQPETARLAVSTITSDLAELAQCLTVRDIERLGKVVHRIHGGMAMLDMRPAAALCRAIEESIEFEWREEAIRMAPVLQGMLMQIRDDIDLDER